MQTIKQTWKGGVVGKLIILAVLAAIPLCLCVAIYSLAGLQGAVEATPLVETRGRSRADPIDRRWV